MEVLYRWEDKPTGVPYYRPVDDEGSHNYVNLRKSPESIDKLPECVRESSLRAFVAYLNREESVLETIGCECALVSVDEELVNGEIRPAYFQKKGYINVVFQDRTLGADSGTWNSVVEKAKLILEPARSTNITLDLVLSPCHLIEEGVVTLLLDMWLIACWTDQEKTEELWEKWFDFSIATIDKFASEVKLEKSR